MIWRANTEKLCDYFNTTWLKFTGRTLEQERGYGWTENVHPDDIEFCVKKYNTSFDQKQPFSMEYRLKNSYGKYRWILDYGSPYYDLDGSFLGYIGACYDITVNKKNIQRLQELSITDSLTKAYNRLKLDTVIESEVKRASRYKIPLSLIAIDIDNFKEINDKYGHQSGDHVLVNVSKALLNGVRETDIVGRWGGEEFMIVCPNTETEGAVALAEKLKLAIENYHFSDLFTRTASFGVTSYSNDEDIDIFIKRADIALYRAKNGGKNRVEAEKNSKPN